MKTIKKEETACGVAHCMSLIGSKWKPIILVNIANDCNRFNSLMRAVKGINRQMLSKQLREMDRAGILDRVTYGEIPPRVEYTLTPLGKSLLPVLEAMEQWSLGQQKPLKKPKAVKKNQSNQVDAGQLPLFG